MIDQEKIRNQCLNEDPEERIKAIEQLKNIFSFLPNDEQAWADLHELIGDQDFFVRFKATSALGFVFFQISDKQKAWNDLHSLTSSQDSYVRAGAAYALGSAFSQVPDKQKAWNDLIRLIHDQAIHVKFHATKSLNSVFSDVPDKQQVWNDLIGLTNDDNNFVKHSATEALGSAFSQVPNKQQAWKELHRLTSDEDYSVRCKAAVAIGSAFSDVPDKKKAWNDLHRLTKDKDSHLRESAVDALGSAFSDVPDKKKAWNDLHRLTRDKDSWVRYRAAVAIGSAFSDVPDKKKAWNDLHRLTNDEVWIVRKGAVDALGSAFSDVPDKKKAWNDLFILTNDEDYFIRSSSNYSLGKASIFKACQAETDEDYKKELENAIKFFEKTVPETPDIEYNPAQFCLPFYRSFFTIIFKKQEAKEEVDKYLQETKNAIEESKSKELLFEAVENLANALREVQNLENLDFEAKKGELNFYRKYFDRAADLMRETEETAPYAVGVMRIGLPILDGNIKTILEEIQRKARITCKESQGTPTQEIACAVNREIQKWEITSQEDIAYSVCENVQIWEISSQEEMSWHVPNIVLLLKSKIPPIPENKEILDMIESMMYEKDLTKQYRTLSTVIGLIPTVNVIPVEPVIGKIDTLERKIDDIIFYVEPGVHENLILHLGPLTPAGGLEYTLTIPLQGVSYSEIQGELKEITGKRISQLSMLPKKVAKIVEEYLVKNKLEDLLNKLR